MAAKTGNEAPEAPHSTVTLEVCGTRVVDGHQPGETFVVDLGPEIGDPDDDPAGVDARAATVRQVWAWVMGEHVTITRGGHHIDGCFKAGRRAKGGDR